MLTDDDLESVNDNVTAYYITYENTELKAKSSCLAGGKESKFKRCTKSVHYQTLQGGTTLKSGVPGEVSNQK